MSGDDRLGNVHRVITINKKEHSLDACSVWGVLSPSHASTHVILIVSYEEVLLLFLSGR